MNGWQQAVKGVLITVYGSGMYCHSYVGNIDIHRNQVNVFWGLLGKGIILLLI
ncbi:hypothetical protein [Vallitalea guaymasensis]|uniref:hypothetical protein n=1 Tax=Vallitalea guaymasensis TaxID=1185412 RepID=UPI0023557D82|nr:hypothetical protein [Vallitalea guaymasensis]